MKILVAERVHELAEEFARLDPSGESFRYHEDKCANRGFTKTLQFNLRREAHERLSLPVETSTLVQFALPAGWEQYHRIPEW